MSDERTIREGRVWMQFKKFELYRLVLLGGMTDITRPRGALNPSRRPSRQKRGEEDIIDVMRGSPGLPTFTLATRLQKSYNYLLDLDCRVNVQAHLGKCSLADNYYTPHTIVSFFKAYAGDMSMPTITQIEGDDAKIEYTVPFSAVEGPVFIDLTKYFLSARTITEAGDITDMAFFGRQCFEDCAIQKDAGDAGYAVADAYAGSPTDVAGMYYTVDKANTWTPVSSLPFAAGESISAVLLAGVPDDHRVWAFRGTADGGNPAECAYADVTEFGTVSWNYVNIGVIDGQYVTYAFYLDDSHVFAVTNDGYVYKSENGGVSWTAVYTTAGVELTDVSALANGTVMVSGASNTVLLSEDGGDSFSAVSGPSAGDDLLTCTITPDGTIFVGTDAGQLYGSYNKAVTWTLLPVGASIAEIRRIRAFGDDIVAAIGDQASGTGVCVYSTDGGASFRLWSLDMPANSGLNALVVVDPNLLFVGGNAHPGGGVAFVSRTMSNLIGVG